MAKELYLDPKTSFRLRSELASRTAGCFLCGWILRDLNDHGKLTGWPYDYNDKSNFPVESKLAHLGLEGISVDKCVDPTHTSVDEKRKP